jgi:serine/threonine protein kinase
LKLYKGGGNPYIVTILKIGDIPQNVFFDMELCDMNLADYIYGSENEGTVVATYFIKDHPPPLKSQQIWNVMLQITKGVEFLHGKKMVHRDLKPVNGTHHILTILTNIVLYSRKDSVWKVADFGFTTQLRQSQSTILTQDGRGTEGYYPPEFLDETAELRYSTKLDIWQLGCILFELAVGRRAFSSNWATLRLKIGHSQLEIPLRRRPISRRRL